jgi:hypothetical protein
MYCMNCGNRSTESDQFCAKCGTRVGTTRAPAPLQQSRSIPKRSSRSFRWAFIVVAIAAAYFYFGLPIDLTGNWTGTPGSFTTSGGQLVPNVFNVGVDVLHFGPLGYICGQMTLAGVKGPLFGFALGRRVWMKGKVFRYLGVGDIDVTIRGTVVGDAILGNIDEAGGNVPIAAPVTLTRAVDGVAATNQAGRVCI